jgi:HAD superfamily hydrolase (TIGR01456 family)
MRHLFTVGTYRFTPPLSISAAGELSARRAHIGEELISAEPNAWRHGLNPATEPQVHRTAMSAAAKKQKTSGKDHLVAVAFDIDGVFKYGREWSPDGFAALQKLHSAGIPHVFVTNGGGGLLESTYAAGFASKVKGAAVNPTGLEPLMSEANMILSYSPWKRALGPQLADRRVLLVGDPRDKVLQVAQSYGLKKAVHYQDYAKLHHTINPFRAAREDGASHTAVANAAEGPIGSHSVGTAHFSDNDDPFAAVLVMCDPYEWFEALQIIVDILCSPTPANSEYDASVPPVPVHFSNPDVLWKAQHPYARFGQGAFKIALRALYKTRLRSLRVPEEMHDDMLASSFRQWGKPTDATFRFLEERLRDYCPPAGDGRVERFYMVGDNPASDIEGVRRANIFHKSQANLVTWSGVLVQTGVYKEGDETNGAMTTVHGVAEAVDWILNKEGR